MIIIFLNPNCEAYEKNFNGKTTNLMLTFYFGALKKSCHFTQQYFPDTQDESGVNAKIKETFKYS